ncbi:AIPR family protein [Helicobacter cetorum]|uniref:AIPR family protein n=1 Tax=Helicobacter cetorum TaxID=138563 RepID=UPI0018F861EC|nr:AIPR family protein [Helicobacter cetorum]
MATVKFQNLKNLILTTDGHLKQSLFMENFRSCIGQTNVNQSIEKTLNNESKKCYFPFLNNGLVIVCDNIERERSKK